jgi:hypothetical protein
MSQSCISSLISANEWLWPPTDHRRGWLPRFIFCGSTRRVAALHLVAWRSTCALSMLCAALYAWGSVADEHEAAFYLSYLTYESLWLNLSYFVFASILGIDALVHSPSRPRLFRRLSSRVIAHRVLSSLLAIAVSFTSVVVVIFWALLFRLLTTEEKNRYLPENIVIHGVVLLPPWIDMIVGATRLHFRTFIVCFIAALLYLVVNCSVSLTVHPVYSILTWRIASDAIIVLGVFFVLLVAAIGAASISVAVERAVEPGGRWARCGADAGATFSIASLEIAVGKEKGFKPCVAGCEPGSCEADDETDPLCERSHFSDDKAEHLCEPCCTVSNNEKQNLAIGNAPKTIQQEESLSIEVGNTKSDNVIGNKISPEIIIRAPPSL